MASQMQKVGQLQPETLSDRASSGHGVHVQTQPPNQGDHRLAASYGQGSLLIESEDDGNTSSTLCYPVRTIDGARGLRDPLDDYYVPKPYIPVNFDAVFNEPGEAGGLGVTHIVNEAIYYGTKRFLYVVFSCLLGPFLAFFFGMVFAIFQFIRIWMVNPVVRICQFNITCLEMIYRPCIRTVLDPCFEAVCQAWRRVTSTERSYKLKITGLALGQNAAKQQETTLVVEGTKKKGVGESGASCNKGKLQQFK